MISSVLFDMDGLLVDSETLNVKVVEKLFSRQGISLTEDDKQNLIVGTTDEKAYKDLSQRYNLDVKIDEVLSEHFQLYDKLLLNDLEVFPGAETLPRMFKEKGFKIGLVSGSTRNEIDIVLKKLKLENAFEVIVSCDDIKTSKPNPEGYLLGAQKLDVKPEECLVLEDAKAGVAAGKAAGMKVIGVINNGEQDLSQADLVVKNLREIEEMIESDRLKNL